MSYRDLRSFSLVLGIFCDSILTNLCSGVRMRFVGRYHAKESKPRKSTTYIRRRTNSGLDGLSGRNRILDVFLLIIYQQNRRYNQLPGLRAPSHWRIVETYGRRRAASRRLPRDSLLRPLHSYTLTLHAR